MVGGGRTGKSTKASGRRILEKIYGRKPVRFEVLRSYEQKVREYKSRKNVAFSVFGVSANVLELQFMSSGRVLHTMSKMNGQWLGNFSGSTTGSVVVNIDERQEHYEGTAVLIEDDQTLPHSVVSFRTANKEPKFQFRTEPILALDPRTGNGLSLDELKQRLGKDEVFSKYTDVAGTVDRESLTLTWSTNTGVEGKCVLPRSKAGQPSEFVPLEKNWAEFMEYVSNLKGCRYLFRGQNEPWRLRTSFHRSGRADLSRFLSEDVPALYKHLSARTKHVFNLNNPDENGAL